MVENEFELNACHRYALCKCGSHAQNIPTERKGLLYWILPKKCPAGAWQIAS